MIGSLGEMINSSNSPEFNLSPLPTRKITWWCLEPHRPWYTGSQKGDVSSGMVHRPPSKTWISTSNGRQLWGFYLPPENFKMEPTKNHPICEEKIIWTEFKPPWTLGFNTLIFEGLLWLSKYRCIFLGGTSREKFNGWERSEGPIRPINSKMLAKPIPFSIPVWKKTTRWRWTYPKYVGGFLWSKVERQSWFQLGFQWSRSSSLFSTSNPWLNQATFCCCGWHVESSF